MDAQCPLDSEIVADKSMLMLASSSRLQPPCFADNRSTTACSLYLSCWMSGAGHARTGQARFGVHLVAALLPPRHPLLANLRQALARVQALPTHASALATGWHAGARGSRKAGALRRSLHTARLHAPQTGIYETGLNPLHVNTPHTTRWPKAISSATSAGVEVNHSRIRDSNTRYMALCFLLGRPGI